MHNSEHTQNIPKNKTLFDKNVLLVVNVLEKKARRSYAENKFLILLSTILFSPGGLPCTHRVSKSLSDLGTFPVIITAILKHFICIFSLYKMMGFIVAFSYIYITYLDHIHPLLTLFCPLPFHRSPSSALVISFCFYHFQTPHVTDFSSQSGLFCLI